MGAVWPVIDFKGGRDRLPRSRHHARPRTNFLSGHAMSSFLSESRLKGGRQIQHYVGLEGKRPGDKNSTGNFSLNEGAGSSKAADRQGPLISSRTADKIGGIDCFCSPARGINPLPPRCQLPDNAISNSGDALAKTGATDTKADVIRAPP